VRLSKILLALLSLTTPACSGEDAAESPDASASATLSATTGNTATGSAKFTSEGSDVTLKVSITNVAPSSVHAFHLHVNPACGADGMDAGGHWGPTAMMHGRWSATPHHLGDVGNLTADAAGQIAFELRAARARSTCPHAPGTSPGVARPGTTSSSGLQPFT
jgi:Cu-Zn family superoxide dismutase